ncbi:MAG: hypothetical protein AAB901_02540, partial [Patescibacteria group bacterium]
MLSRPGFNLNHPGERLVAYSFAGLFSGFFAANTSGWIQIALFVLLAMDTFVSLVWLGTELSSFVFGENGSRIRLLCASLSVAAAAAAVVFAFSPL